MPFLWVLRVRRVMSASPASLFFKCILLSNKLKLEVLKAMVSLLCKFDEQIKIC